MFKCRRALLLFSTILICENVQFNLYDTELFSGSSWDRDCIYYYVRNNINKLDELTLSPIFLVHQIIPYCLRSMDTNQSKFNLISSIKQHSTFRFEELRLSHISSYQLYTWSASIDVAEEYELYLNKPTSNNELLFFHNCTLPWFGVLCQYTFAFETNYSVADIVEATFAARKESKKIDNFTCYIHLDCIRGPDPICLDWREICDGSMDCSDGIDEKNCWKMEINECEEHEYRCHNGQCIPEEYLLDDLWNPECIDSTDELVSYLPRLLQCISDPAIRCEDHVCPLLRYTSSFACGDGQCVQANQVANHQCQNGRDILWAQSLIDHTTNLLDQCIWIMICISHIIPPAMYDIDCNQLCQYNGCRDIIKLSCPKLFEFPAYPVIFGHVYFIYANDELEYITEKKIPPSYICYDEQLCTDFLPATKRINGRACRRYNETVLREYSHIFASYWFALILDTKYVFEACLSIHQSVYEQFHNHSEIFHCANSTKFISKHRLVDGRRDCPANDDEVADACTVKNEYRFKCSKKNTNNNNSICVPAFRVMDGSSTCPDNEDGKISQLYNIYIRPNLSLIDFNNFWSSYEIEKYNFFSHICNGIKQFIPILINGQYHTDETECENWPCNNIYSQCDMFWSCKNGTDELNCSPSKCPYLHHLCVSPVTLKLTCLPIAKAGDGIIDCLGATDELQHCQNGSSIMNMFRCATIKGDTCLRVYLLCDKKEVCLFSDDEKFCQHYMTGQKPLCASNKHDSNRSEEENFFCSLSSVSPQIKKYFTLGNLTNYVSSFETKKEHQFKQNLISIENNFQWAQQCKRGLRVRVISEDNNTYKCLCPPAYYGDTCEYQNQRVSLTIQIRTITHWQNMFTVVFLLINYDDQTIESYDQIEFISIRDCGIKYHVNLLYSTRPKDETKNYSIRIDVFDRHLMEYRGSWNYPVIFSFLPVNRMAIILVIPAHQVESTCNTLNCGFHGRCLKFVNSNETFCKCNDIWSGKGCTTISSSNFLCASDSLTVGIIHNRSICVCPLGKFGSRCYLKHISCPDDMCKNGGTCVMRDERMLGLKSICTCKEGYSGTNCEIRDTQIDISLEKLPIPSAILVHFITAYGDKPESRMTTFRKIPVDQTSATVYVSSMFHLIFIEYFDVLYFAYIQHIYTSGKIIKTTVKPSHRCPSIDEIFHVSITKLHQLRRVKRYPIACQQQSNLLCFYDDSYICFCYNNDTPNCFIFNHNMTYNCQGYNYCQNGGRCFQNDIVCPTSSMCECIDCFYGSRCQFSSKGFELSLDLILGPHIHPKNYSLVMQISIFIVLLLTLFGFINGTHVKKKRK